MEKQLNNHEILKFNDYATKWWNSYKQIKSSFKKRPVKIYAQDENGIQKPVMSFVRPLYGIRGIDSPFHAARFVSLFPYITDLIPGKE